MKIIYKGYLGRDIPPFSEWDSEVQEAVSNALELVKNKSGFKTHLETWYSCELEIIIGHNIYTSSIHIQPTKEAVKNRISRYYNGHAYYCNGVFFASLSRIKVELI